MCQAVEQEPKAFTVYVNPSSGAVGVNLAQAQASYIPQEFSLSDLAKLTVTRSQGTARDVVASLLPTDISPGVVGIKEGGRFKAAKGFLPNGHYISLNPARRSGCISFGKSILFPPLLLRITIA